MEAASSSIVKFPSIVQVFALTESLHEDTQIVSLDLSYNNIDDAGAATISRLLKVRGLFDLCIFLVSVQAIE
jgi:hypothetical protein